MHQVLCELAVINCMVKLRKRHIGHLECLEKACSTRRDKAQWDGAAGGYWRWIELLAFHQQHLGLQPDFVNETEHLFATAFTALSMEKLGGYEIEIPTHQTANLPRIKQVFRSIFQSDIDDLDGVDVLDDQAIDREDLAVFENGEVG